MWRQTPRCCGFATRGNERVADRRLAGVLARRVASAAGTNAANEFAGCTVAQHATIELPNRHVRAHAFLRQNDRRRRAAGRVVGSGRARAGLARRLRDVAAVLAQRRRRHPISHPRGRQRLQGDESLGQRLRVAATGIRTRHPHLSCPRRRPAVGHRGTGAERVGEGGSAGAATGRPHRLAANRRSAHRPAGGNDDRRRRQLQRDRPLATIADSATFPDC